jgi:hypothetical protein
MMKRNPIRSFAAWGILMMGLAASATAQHSDVGLALEGGVPVIEQQVVEGMFGEAPNPANVADEPGFEAEDGVLLPEEFLSFQAVPISVGGASRNLWYWDGAGDVAFGESPETLSIEHPVSGQTLALSTALPGVVQPGFVIGAADEHGGLHQDLEFVLGSATPASGVYLFALSLQANSIGAVDPVYLVMGAGVEDELLDAAVDYVNASIVPEPAAVAMLLSAFAWMGLVRRRRSGQ